MNDSETRKILSAHDDLMNEHQRVAMEIAKTLGLETDRLMSFSIRFVPFMPPTVEAEYFTENQDGEIAKRLEIYRADILMGVSK